MAKVYDTISGADFPSGVKTIRDSTGNFRGRNDRSLERFIALHEDVQMKLIAEGQKIHQRAKFRMTAVQARHEMRLREELQEAIQSGDPEAIREKQENLNYYRRNKTDVIQERSDIDYYIMLYREDGKEFFVEVEGDGNRGFHILTDSLTH